MDIQLGNSGLTKIVVFTPFYKILNKAPFDLEVMEAELPHAEWFTILSGKKERLIGSRFTIFQCMS